MSDDRPTSTASLRSPDGCLDIVDGMLMSDACRCGHPAGSHLYPSALCVECAVLSRLDRIEERLRRLEAR